MKNEEMKRTIEHYRIFVDLLICGIYPDNEGTECAIADYLSTGYCGNEILKMQMKYQEDYAEDERDS